MDFWGTQPWDQQNCVQLKKNFTKKIDFWWAQPWDRRNCIKLIDDFTKKCVWFCAARPKRTTKLCHIGKKRWFHQKKKCVFEEPKRSTKLSWFEKKIISEMCGFLRYAKIHVIQVSKTFFEKWKIEKWFIQFFLNAKISWNQCFIFYFLLQNIRESIKCFEIHYFYFSLLYFHVICTNLW